MHAHDEQIDKRLFTQRELGLGSVRYASFRLFSPTKLLLANQVQGFQ